MNLLTKDTYVKHNLGKLWILFCFVLLQAEDFTYAFNVDQPNPYVKEAVILTLDVNQTNHDVVLLFDFDLEKSKHYSFQRIGIKEDDAHHTMQIHYTYLLYPLTSGDLNITFKMTKKVTTDDSVAYSFSGDRDNVKGLVTKDFQVDLTPATLTVKPLPKDTQVVGDFTLAYTIKTHQAKAYEALPFQVTLTGNGYPPLIKHLLPKDVNFTLFTENPIVHSSADAKGIHSTVTYPMALSHSQDFSLPNMTLKAFNPKTQKSYTLTVPSQNFKVTEVATVNLVDKIDYPPTLKADWSWVQTLLGYLVVFAAGYLSALAFKWQKKTISKTENPLIEKIQKTKDSKVLLQLLMAYDSHRFASCIKDLESTLYGDGKIKQRNININKVKEEAIGLV